MDTAIITNSTSSVNFNQSADSVNNTPRAGVVVADDEEETIYRVYVQQMVSQVLIYEVPAKSAANAEDQIKTNWESGAANRHWLVDTKIESHRRSREYRIVCVEP